MGIKKIENINDLSTILVEYIENNKAKYGVKYKASIDTLKEVLNELEKDYNMLGD